MAGTVSAKGEPARGASLPRSVAEMGASTLDRLASFRFIYLAIFATAVLYITTVNVVESLLATHFRNAVIEATRVSPVDGPIVPQIQKGVAELVRGSPWTRVGRIDVNVFVFGADGTPIFLGGGWGAPPPPPADLDTLMWEAMRLLPAAVDVEVVVPLDSVLAVSILLAYGSVLLTVLFFYNRSVARREAALLTAAMTARDVTAERAQAIEGELERVRERLGEVEPSEQAHAEEIRSLQDERQALQRKLGALAEREAELRQTTARFSELESERQTLEELLDEAVEDLRDKEGEIQNLQTRLKSAAKAAPPSGRARAADQLARRLRTLYRNLEVEGRAVQDLIGLRDETMKLKAEEGLKRLNDDPDTAAVRRKVGGLPPQLSIYELGFAGKGRIYYTRGRQNRYRVLAIGAKNTQKTDLEYLSRLSPE